MPGCRVLIVEDEFITAMDLEAIVESFGHRVVGPVKSPDEAIELAGNETADIALLDVALGTERALPVADELDRLGIPYALVTAYDSESLGPRFKNALYVSKPFRTADIEAAIKSLRAAALHHASN